MDGQGSSSGFLGGLGLGDVGGTGADLTGGKKNAQGGISPQQMAYAQYQGAEDAVSGAQQFSQIPTSTNQTFATAVGPAATTAYSAITQSDKDAAAMNAASQQKKGQVGQGIGGLGSALGGGGGGGGGGGIGG